MEIKIPLMEMENVSQNNTMSAKKRPAFCRILLFLVAVGLNIDSFSIQLFSSFKVSVVTVIIIFYLIFCINYIAKIGIIRKRYKKVFLCIVILFILLIWTNIINANTVSSKIVPFDILFCIILFFVTLSHLEFDELAYKYLLWGVVTGGLLAVLLFNLGIGVEYYGAEGRLMLFGLNPNNVGCMICVSFAILLYKGVLKSRKGLLVKGLFALALVSCLLMIFATASRTAFVVLIVIVSTILMYSSRGMNNSSKLFIVIIILIGIYASYKILLSSEAMLSRLLFWAESNDVSGRDSIWKRLLPILFNHPFGIGQTGYTEYTYLTFHTTDITGLVSPHNVFLEIAIYTGLIGLFLFSSFIFQLLKAIIKKFKIYNDLLPVLLFEILFIQMNLGQMLIFKIAWLIFAYLLYNSSMLVLRNSK